MGPTWGVSNFFVLLVFALCGMPGRAQVSEGTHSPHGNLTVPCQNCHTASAWKPIRAVPEFDHNQTRYPLRGLHQSVDLRSVPCEASVHERWTALSGLSRRYSPPPTRCELRTMPHRPRLAGNRPTDPAAQQPFPFDWSPCGGGLRLVPQRRRQQPVSDDVDRVLLLPLGGFQSDLKSKPCDGHVFHEMHDLPRHRHVAQRDLRPLVSWIPSEWRARGAAATMHRLPPQQQLQPNQYGLRKLPSQGLPRDDQSQSRVRKFLADLQSVSQHHVMVERVV